MPLPFSPLLSHPTTIHKDFPCLPMAQGEIFNGWEVGFLVQFAFHFNLGTEVQVKRSFCLSSGRDKAQVLCSYEYEDLGHCTLCTGQTCAQRTQGLGQVQYISLALAFRTHFAVPNEARDQHIKCKQQVITKRRGFQEEGLWSPIKGKVTGPK